MVSHTQIELGLLQVKQFRAEIGDKDRISLTNDGLGVTMELEDVVSKVSCHNASSVKVA